MLARIFKTPQEAAAWRVDARRQYQMEMIDVVASDAAWFAEHGILARLIKENERKDLEFMDIGGEG